MAQGFKLGCVQRGGWRIAPRPGCSGRCAPPNKRMHATRDTKDVIKRHLAGGRVMRGVRRRTPCRVYKSITSSTISILFFFFSIILTMKSSKPSLG